MSIQETGKSRAERIPYHYLGSPDRIIQSRLIYSGVALMMVFLWLCWGWVNPELDRLRASHGTLSRAHSTWETRCDACHTAPPPLESFLNSPRWEGIGSTKGDDKCKSCHMGSDAQGHHPGVEDPAKVPHCVQCHDEHQGLEHSLVHLVDRQCTSCHENLRASLAHPEKLTVNSQKITRFSLGSHPDVQYKKLNTDPGKLKFNHSLHLRSGLRFQDDDVPLTSFKDLRKTDRARYGWKPNAPLDDLVTLDCASCHHLEPEPTTQPILAERESSTTAANLTRQKKPGAYFRPIAYGVDCVACHRNDLPGSPNQLEMRHGLQPPELESTVRGAYWKRLLEAMPTPIKELQISLIPGKTQTPTSFGNELEARVQSAGRVLFGQGKASCTECHYYTSEQGKVEAQPPLGVDPFQLQIALPNVPEIWMKHARFDHSAHRALECKSCHSGVESSGKPVPHANANATKNAGWTMSDGRPTWKSHEDILLPGIEICVECHAPRGSSSTNPTGGAGFDCTECHLYHDRDPSPLRSISSAAGARDLRDIKRFLTGPPKRTLPGDD